MITVLVAVIVAAVVFWLLKIALVSLGLGTLGIALAALVALCMFLGFLKGWRDRVLR